MAFFFSLAVSFGLFRIAELLYRYLGIYSGTVVPVPVDLLAASYMYIVAASRSTGTGTTVPLYIPVQ